jgi:hypothetical protein
LYIEPPTPPSTIDDLVTGALEGVDDARADPVGDRVGGKAVQQYDLGALAPDRVAELDVVEGAEPLSDAVHVCHLVPLSTRKGPTVLPLSSELLRRCLDRLTFSQSAG